MRITESRATLSSDHLRRHLSDTIKSFATFASKHLLLDSGYRAAGNSNFGFNTAGVGALRADLPKFADFHPPPRQYTKYLSLPVIHRLIMLPKFRCSWLPCNSCSASLLLNSFSKEFGVAQPGEPFLLLTYVDWRVRVIW
jgi:hypothetical protein